MKITNNTTNTYNNRTRNITRKVLSYCTLLASKLNKNFYSTNRYDPIVYNNNLTKYLQNNGVLLTMCMSNFCLYNGTTQTKNETTTTTTTTPKATTRNFKDSTSTRQAFESSYLIDTFFHSYSSRTGIQGSRGRHGPGGIFPEEDHISGSWVQYNNNTSNDKNYNGFNVILGSNIGYILDPTNVTIHCIYPTDAMTDFRSTKGCGPMYNDPINGINGYNHNNIIQRYIQRKKIEYIEEFLFHCPHNICNMSTISCRRRYFVSSLLPFQLSIISWSILNNDTTAKSSSKHTSTTTTVDKLLSNSTSLLLYDFATMLKTQALYDEPYVHRPTCAIQDEKVLWNDRNGVLFYYNSTKLWNNPAIEWQQMIDIMNDLITIVQQSSTTNSTTTTAGSTGSTSESSESYYSSYSIWNEIVFDQAPTNDNIKDIVQAVFVKIDNTMYNHMINSLYEQAVIEASYLTDKATTTIPVLFANVSAIQYTMPVFTCPNNNDNNDISNDIINSVVTE